MTYGRWYFSIRPGLLSFEIEEKSEALERNGHELLGKTVAVVTSADIERAKGMMQEDVVVSVRMRKMASGCCKPTNTATMRLMMPLRTYRV
ncbi:unnamed protein product [Vitrella brassicaformis CCMP3155]|uniref:Uncharacterized protein n=1 Tax=Vitrella brassicaformis (strain CCMP3155) TaxID=1169540 RepID=A0A0G4H710_VITBC|nr:unnamed protein product [Vitrella brassicaformis CCMP3155]|eukprot:CEM39656.1 unnamed protein product [Vitrella brassicaformis CCMP3155]